MFRRITVLAALAVLGATAADAQAVLRRGADFVTVWTDAGAPVDVPLAGGLEARTAIQAEGGRIVAGTDPRRGELFFLHETDGEIRELPAVAQRTDGRRTWPVPLAADGRLEGVVWLEGAGPQDFDVRAAAWNGTSWEGVELVAQSGGAPQLAVSATVLADGSWLAVWAAFDGEDDEILWSHRLDGRWSPPRRLHRGNRVPDILPSVTAHDDRAVAAWSTYDGNDYRVRTAEWDGARWRSGGPLEGRGAIDAGWQTVDDRTFLVYHSVEPEAWTLIEVDRDGAVAARRTFAGDNADRPLVSARGGGAARLVFPTREGADR